MKDIHVFLKHGLLFSVCFCKQFKRGRFYVFLVICWRV